jgi:DnaJ-class molecular chaperone
MLFSILFGLGLIQSEGTRDFYEILGLQHDCIDREIEVAFQKLSRKYHPDKNKGNANAAERFTDINDAYATLKDAQKRRVFDLYGEPGVHIYESPRNEIGDLFGLTTSEDPSNTLGLVRKKGRTFRIVFPVDLIDFFRSNRYRASVARRTMCRCPKAGYFCPRCRGRPTIRENATLEFYVEKGSDDGSIILFKNAGDSSEANAAGDIEIEVVSRPHPIFQRRGSDLHVSLDVTLREALLGFTKKIPSLDGSELSVVSVGPIDKELRVKGKGLPLYLSPGDFGDIVVHPVIKWPKGLSAEAKNAVAGILAKSQ